ncbi:hypothetical protein Hamer_G022119 [Homarus americanus]|uniref:Uncharacterized protein n=1 Tax=Homarus americanus TaxID=6706 RepID=A0A8J5JC83_HOMAM|nr:hypothetical protein Hamer_G022119 [Homarus americanus]
MWGVGVAMKEQSKCERGHGGAQQMKSIVAVVAVGVVWACVMGVCEGRPQFIDTITSPFNQAFDTTTNFFSGAGNMITR